MNNFFSKFFVFLFLTWRFSLFLFVYVSEKFFSLQKNFLGGGFENYINNPLLWSWANFDGEHYLFIATSGYQPFKYFFFPLYPILIRWFSSFFGQSFISYLYSGLLISHISLFVGLIALVKLIKMDFGKDILISTLILIFVFPTSFYFASVYTESLFFALVNLFFYFLCRKKWFIASLLGALSSATRVVGVSLSLVFLVEYFSQKRDKNFKPWYGICLGILIVFGILFYMFYLNQRANDPFAFLHSLKEVYGEQRSSSIVLLPQVFYRYIFKVLPNINYSFFPAVFTGWLEFITGFIFAVFCVLGFLASFNMLDKDYSRFRLSYSFYMFLGYIIPTLSGSFSSLPRYVLVLFPFFILLSLIIKRFPKFFKFLIFSTLFLLLWISTMLFARGYFVS